MKWRNFLLYINCSTKCYYLQMSDPIDNLFIFSYFLSKSPGIFFIIFEVWFQSDQPTYIYIQNTLKSYFKNNEKNTWRFT